MKEMNFIHILVATLSVAYFYSSNKRNKQKWLYLFFCGLILFFSFFRDVAKGYDTEGYMQFFQTFRKLPLSECLKWDFEPGYIYINKIIGKITDDSQVFISILSIFTLVPIFFLVWKKSENPILSLLIFVAVGNLFHSYAALRQWCAVAILVFSYDFIVNRRLLLFLGSVALAYYFHQTALFMIPMYFLYPIKITRTKILICIPISFTMYVLSDPLMRILNMFARIEMEVYQQGGYISLLTYWALVILIDVFGFPTENEKYMKLNYLALLYSAIIQPLSLSYGVFARIHLYTWFGMVLGIPRFIQYMGRNYEVKNSIILRLAVILIMIVWYLVTQEGKGLSLIIA